MVTDIEYALMAGRAYQTTRDLMNQFPIPQGWLEFAHVPNNPDYPIFTGTNGFEAVSFQNTSNPNEIVISFAGTGPGMNQDWWANSGLYTGFGSEQLMQAAEYYLQVKAANSANPNIEITLTGHSLGGGLASLVGVFFGENAITFDQAPFAHSAEPNLLPPDVAANLLSDLAAQLDSNNNRIYSDADLAGLTNYINVREITGGIPNANLIHDIHVDGEILSAWSDRMIGVQTPLTHGVTDVSSIDLHLQSLLTVFVQNDQFRQLTFKLPELLEIVFDRALYYHDPSNTDNPERNFLEHLVRHQVGVQNSFAADYMLDRFTTDLQKIAQPGGLTMANNDLTKALTAFAMQMYYTNPGATNIGKHLFSDTGITGGIHFDRRDVADTLAIAKGYTMYFQNYLATLPEAEHTAINQQLSALLDWYIQAGTQAMNATAGSERAFMLGGNGADQLTGGGQADLLIGNSGDDTLNGAGSQDTLIGGEGRDLILGGDGDDIIYAGSSTAIQGEMHSDTLIGGAGVDEYHISLADTVNDSDGQGTIFYGNLQVANLLFNQQGQTDIYFNEATSLFARHDQASNNLEIFTQGAIAPATSPTIFSIEHFTPGNFGISLEPEDTLPSTYDITLAGSADHDEMGLIVYGQQAQLLFASFPAGVTGSVPLYEELLPATAPHLNITGGDSGDYLFGFVSHDQIDGGGGGDIIQGYLGWWNSHNLDTILPGPLEGDKLSGRAGNDFIQGTCGEDTLDGGADNDILSGFDGDDLIIGDSGNDILLGASHADILVGDDGDDIILGDGHLTGNFSLTLDSLSLLTTTFTESTPGGFYIGYVTTNIVLHPDAPNGGGDILEGGAGRDYLDGGAGQDSLFGGLAADTVIGGEGDDYLEGEDGDDWLVGDNGDLTGSGADVMFGGAGTDLLYGGGGGDFLYGGVENDDLYGNGGNDYLDGDIGDDNLLGSDGDDTLDGGEGVDYLDGEAGMDLLAGGLGDDTLYGGTEVDTLSGGDGVDYLNGGDGNDLLTGGLGDDTLDGGAGDDTYFYNLGEGADVIVNSDGPEVTPSILAASDGPADLPAGKSVNTLNYAGNSGIDTLVFGAGINLTDFSQVFKYENYLILVVGETGNQVAIANWFSDSNYRIDQLRFADGATISGNEFVTTMPLVSNGTTANDILTGYEGSDFLYGFAGNDTMNGGAGNDTLDGGLGSDTMVGGAGDDTYLVDSTGDVVNEQANEGTDTVNASFTSASSYTLAANIENLVLTGTDASYGRGNALDNELIGNSANNYLYGYAGADYLDGEAGNDNLLGDVGADILDGGIGNDTLTGGTGNNTYLFGLGDGQDIINSTNDTTVGRLSTLQFKPGVLPFEVVVKQVSGTLELSIAGTTDKITINQFFYTDNPYNTYNPVQQVQFDDGTVWDPQTLMCMAFVGTGGYDNLRGTIYSETFSGGLGDDYIDGVAGDDSIDGGDGTDTLYGGAGADTLIGGAGYDSLDGGADGDTLDGGAGNDTLTGGTGNNIYLFGKGDGQDLISGQTSDNAAGKLNSVHFKAGVLPSEMVIKQVYDNYRGGKQALELSIAGTADKITINSFFYTDNPGNAYNGVQQVKFDDGTTWDIPSLVAKALTCTEANDNIRGTIANETFNGGLGLDTLNGAAGDDIINGGDDRDSLYGEAGADTLIGEVGDDYLYGGADADTLEGGSDNDLLSGGAGDDLLIGGLGNDNLTGGTGNNTYLFGKGDGQDVIDSTNDTTVGRLNILEFKAGVLPHEVTVKASISVASLELSVVGTTDKITINDFFKNDDPANSYNGVQQVQFADGTVWDIAALLAKEITPTDVNDYIRGTIADETLSGGLGDDVIYGRGGNDIIDGGDGNDSIEGSGLLMGGAGDDHVYGNGQLVGGDGNDTLSGDGVFDGGAGADTLSCGAGNDTILFGKDDGQDVLNIDYKYTDLDTLRFKAGVLPSDVVFKQITQNIRLFDSQFYGDDYLNKEYEIGLELSITGTSDKITIYGFSSTTSTNGYYRSTDSNHVEWFYSQSPIQKVQFEDDTTWQLSDLFARMYTGTAANDLIRGTQSDDAISGGTGEDTLSGYGGNDTLDGGAGNDTLSGGPGDNVYLVGKGDGQDVILNSSDDGAQSTPGSVNTLQFKDGVQPSEIILKSLNDGGASLEISIAGTTDNITIHGFFSESTWNYPYNPVQQVRFADGTIWAVSDLLAKLYDGTAADDSIIGISAGETFNGGFGNDSINGAFGHDIIDGGDGNDTLYGDSGSDTLYGGAGNDLLYGGSESSYSDSDILDGGAGNETLDGGTGNNTYLFGKGDGQDVIAVGAIDTTTGKLNILRFKAGVLPSEIVATKGTGTNPPLVLSLSGTTDKITINGFFTNNTPADLGNPVQQVQFSDGTVWDIVTLEAMTASTIKTGTANAETLAGSTTLANKITGLGGSDTLTGGSASDWLDGGTGNDTMSGGAGNDLYVVDSASDVVTEAASKGNDTVLSSVSYTLSSNAENLILTGTTAIIGTGNTGNNNLIGNGAVNVLDGGAGDDVLIGADGADSMSGGAGNDTYWVENPCDVVTELAGAGTDTVNSTSSYAIADNVENLNLFGTDQITGTGNSLDNTITNCGGNNTLCGAAGNDTLIGGAGDDILDGGTGADTMIGGGGINDIFIVDDAGDVTSGAGTIHCSISYTISGVANLTLTGTAAINGTGNNSNNVLTGNSADNTLTGNRGLDVMYGMGGNDKLDGSDLVINPSYGYYTEYIACTDIMYGGTGNDTYIVEDAECDRPIELADDGTDTVISYRDYTLPANVENLTLADGMINSIFGSEAYNGAGNELDNVITGSLSLCTLSGLGGNDTLISVAGDTLIGGTGDDTYIDAFGNTLIELADEGTDTVITGVTNTLQANIENLTLTGTAAINATGNELDNVLIGNDGVNILTGGAGNDSLDGGAGVDKMTGGIGDDIYIVEVAGETVTELAGEGTDTVYASITYTLGANVENLSLTETAAINATGNTLANLLIGNSADNTLIAGTGNDIMEGGLGADSLEGGSDDDTYIFAIGDGADTIYDGQFAKGDGTTPIASAATTPFDLAAKSPPRIW